MPRQIVIQLARFGDVLQTGRLLRALELEGETHLCVDLSLVPLARRLHPHCEVHGVAAHADGRKLDANLFAELLSVNRRTCADLASLDAGAVYNLNHSPLNFALASLFPSERVRGYRVENGQVLRERWMRFAFRWAALRRSAPLNLVDFWGLLAPHPAPATEVNPPALSGGKGIGVVLAGRQARRSLPPDVLAAMVLALFEGVGGRPVFLLGGRTERGIARKLMEHLPGHVLSRTVNLAGRTDWNGLCDALTNLDLVLSPDTGTMHLAARLGVPVFGLFLSSAWTWETGPYGRGHRVWQADAPCAPCRESQECCNDLACLAPFRDPALLRALFHEAANLVDTGRRGLPADRAGDPPGLILVESGFDELGLTWTPRHETAEPCEGDEARKAGETRRSALRALLAEFVFAQGKMQRRPDGLAPDQTFCAENFYHEADWMLPDAGAFHK